MNAKEQRRGDVLGFGIFMIIVSLMCVIVALVFALPFEKAWGEKPHSDEKYWSVMSQLHELKLEQEPYMEEQKLRATWQKTKPTVVVFSGAAIVSCLVGIVFISYGRANLVDEMSRK